MALNQFDDEISFLVSSGICKNADAARGFIKARDGDVPLEQPGAPMVEFVKTRADWGYEVTPRGKYVFVRPAPPDHPAVGVFPKSEQAENAVGFVFASAIEDLPAGTLVTYDQFSAI